jgi:CheY-like chemotaxis protein
LDDASQEEERQDISLLRLFMIKRSTIDEFLAVLAHELRNPLAVIKNGMDIIESNDPSLHQDAISMISRQVGLLIRLVEDLTDISRVEKGKIILKMALMDIRESINLGVESVRPIINNKSHILKIVADQSYQINGDLMRLSQVFFNLLNNAAKYTADGGEIGLRVETEGESVVVTIEDNGMGIIKETHNLIFDMFYQSEHTLTRSLKGMGIGLALVRNIIKGHGGEVTVHSEGENKGSTFTIKLPLAKKVIAPAVSAVAVVSPITKRRVLLIDDILDIAKSFSMLLKKQGHEVYIAESGAEALCCVRSKNPEFVVSDIGMSDMSGYEIARKVKCIDPKIILIAVTGYGSDEDRKKSEEAGFDYHLVKPIEIKELNDIIK